MASAGSGRRRKLRQERLNFVDKRGACGAIDHGNAVEEKCGGKRAEQEIFQRRFVGNQRAAAEADQDVGGNRAHLQADESGDEFIGACEDAHPRSREQNQGIVFAALDAFAIEIIERAQNRQRGGNDDDDVQKNTEMRRR